MAGLSHPGHGLLRPQMRGRLIPLYSADGALTDWLSPERLARLVSAGLVARLVVHKGHVNRAYLFRRPGEGSPVDPRRYMGIRYSYLERLDNGYRCWSLRKLLWTG